MIVCVVVCVCVNVWLYVCVVCKKPTLIRCWLVGCYFVGSPLNGNSRMLTMIMNIRRQPMRLAEMDNQYLNAV